MKQSDAQKQTGSAFHAAKSLEAAALIYKEMNDMRKAAELMNNAATLYLEHGTPDTAAISLDKAAKMLEQALPEEAIKLFYRACDVSEAEDNPRQAGEMIGKAGRLLIRLKKFDEAAVAIQREINYYIQTECLESVHKLVFGLVLIHLYRGDYVAADQAFQNVLRSCSSFPSSEEAGSIQRLLQAYDEGDPETAESVTRSPLFRYMENDFTKLARDLHIPGTRKQVTQSSRDPDMTGELSVEDDSFPEGLL